MSTTIKTTLTVDGKAFTAGMKEAAAAVQTWKSKVGASVDQVKKSFGGLKGAVIGFGAAGLAIKKALGEAGEFERFEAQLGVLLGSTEKAKERMKELADFGATTPFELPGVMKASIVLETLTQGAMSTKRGLTLVGDAASVAGQPIEELAVHIGRLYDGLQSGRPVGESMARMQELGLVSADVRGQIEDLQKAGKKGAEVWGLMEGAMSRFTGTMDKQSNTLEGRISELKDRINELWREMGKPISDALTPVLADISANMEAYKQKAAELGEKIAALGRFLVDHRKALLWAAGGWLALKGAMFAINFTNATVELAKTIKVIFGQVFATGLAKKALDAETKSLAVNTAAQVVNSKARSLPGGRSPGGGRHNYKTEGKRLKDAYKMKVPGGGRHAGESLATRFVKGFKSKLAGIGPVLGKVLAATVTGATVLVGAAAAAVAVGVAVWAKYQEKISDETLKTHDALNKVASASWEAVNAAKTAEDTEAARAEIAAEISKLKEKAAAEGNAERKTAIETQIASLALLSTQAEDMRLRNLSAEAAEKAAAQAELERKNAEFANRLDAERIENAKKLAVLAKERAAAVAEANAKMRADLGVKLFDRQSVDKQLEILKSGLVGMMKEVNSSQDITERLAGRGGAKLPDLDAIQRAADAARGRGDVDQEKILLEYLGRIFEQKEKIFEIEKAQLETKKEQAKAAGDFTLEGKILDARARGNDALVKSLERQQAIEAMKLELMRSQGLAADAALTAARKRVDLEKAAGEAAEKAAEAKRKGDAGRDFAGELAVLKLRAGGRDGPADALAKEIESRKEAVRLAEDMGISEKDALALIRQKDELERRIEGRKKSGDSGARKRSGIYKLTAEESAARRRERGGGGVGFSRERPIGLRPASFDREARSRESAGKDRAAASTYYERSIGAQEQMVEIFKKLGVMG